MRLFAGAFALVLIAATPALAQSPTAADQAERRAAMGRLDMMKGVWRGPATGANRDGSSFAITQTERVGPLLDGDILLVEGRGYREDGSTGFNAFGVISYDTARDAYDFRSYAMGHSGTFPLTVTDTGYVWEMPAGPGVVRYTATVQGDSFVEVGEFLMPGQPARQTFRMDLVRQGDSAWPAEGAVQPR